MKNFLRKAFGIYPSEIKNTFRFIRMALFWSFGCAITYIISTSFFLEKVGPKFLPLAYISIALFNMVCASIIIYLLRIEKPYKVFFKVIIISSFFYVIFAIFLCFPKQKYFWFILQVFSYTTMDCLIASFWNFLDQYHDLQNAKRIYGIYNTAYFLGWMMAGIFINLVIDHVSLSFLFLIASLFMIISIFEIITINKKVVDIEDDVVEGFFSKGKRGILNIFRSFYRSPFAIFLVVTSLVIQLLRTTTQFNYMQNIASIFKTNVNENSITEFLASCSAVIGCINVIIGIFFYRKMVKILKIVNIILIPPIFFVALYCNWIFINSIIIVILAIFSLDGILDTLDDNNFNLLLNATPSKIRGILRVINDSFFEPVGMLFSSIFLIFLTSHTLFFGISLSLLFLIGSILLKYLYPKAILKNLKENKIYFENKFSSFIKSLNKKEQKEIEQDLINGLKDETESVKLLSFKNLLFLNKEKTFLKILPLIKNSSSHVKIKILFLLDKNKIFSNHIKTLNLIEEWKKSNNSDLKKYCNLYLAKRGFLPFNKNLLLQEDLILKSTAIFSLKKHKNNLSLEKIIENNNLALKEIQTLLDSNEEEKISTALSILLETKEIPFVEKIIQFLNHGSLKVEIMAANILSNVQREKISNYIDLIIEKIKNTTDKKIKKFCLKTIEKIQNVSKVKNVILATSHFLQEEKKYVENIIFSMGKNTIPFLIDILKDIKISYTPRILAGKILARLDPFYLQKNLTKIISKEIEKAYFYFYSTQIIKKELFFDDIKLLIKALFTGFQSSIDFIVHLIGLTKSLEECDLLVHSLKSKNEKVHSNAIETLEQNCEAKIFKQIQPLIDDDIPLEYKIEAYLQRNKNQESFSLKETLSKLEDSPLIFDKIIAVHFKSKFKIPNWQESLKNQMEKNKNKVFQTYGKNLLQIHTNKELKTIKGST